MEAAQSLLRDGIMPTVQQAAEAAKVSRATAYRYFPTQDSLVTEVMAVTPSTDVADEKLANIDTEDSDERVLKVLDIFNPMCLEEEAPYRAALRLYHDLWLEAHARRSSGDEANTPLRGGRRMKWLADASAALREEMPEKTWQRMQYALALTVSIDSITIMHDVCRIEDDEEVLGVLRWTAEAILRAAHEEAEAERAKAGRP